MLALQCSDNSRANNEIISLDDSDSEVEESTDKNESVLGKADNLSDDGDCWDGNIFDMLEVECNESSSLYEDGTFRFKGKIYPIENYCVICKKEFTCQREFRKHAQQDHPNEKAYQCLYCSTVFSKLKSVTSHYNRAHADLDSKSYELNSDNDLNDGDAPNKKGKIYPIESKCAVCEKEFTCQKELFKHAEQSHPNEKVFRCLHCPTIFSKLKSVNTHYKRSHSKLSKTFVCGLCNMSFFTHFLLKRHTRTHTEKRPFACNQCDKTYKYKRNLLVHKKTHKSKKSNSNALNTTQEKLNSMDYYEHDEQNLSGAEEHCENDEQNRFSRDDEYCEILSSESEDEGINISEFALNNESSINLSKEYRFKCNLCGKAYKYKKNLKYHEKAQHATSDQAEEVVAVDETIDQANFNFNNGTYFIIDELNTDCENCEDEDDATGNYSDGYDYEDFVPPEAQSSMDISQNKCGICQKMFTCQQAVAKHLQRCHPEIEFFKCPYCDDNFYSLETLSSHIAVKKHPEKRNICPICLKSFDRRSDLKRHTRIHTDERPYSCTICKKSFKQTAHLRRHKEINHSAYKALGYHCYLCPKRFSVEDALKRHINDHDTETRYPCSMCNKAFRTKYDYRRHQEVHSSRKNLTCEFCLESFESTQSLNLHLQSHTGERMFLCTFCNKSFRDKSHLVNHRRSHTDC